MPANSPMPNISLSWNALKASCSKSANEPAGYAPWVQFRASSGAALLKRASFGLQGEINQRPQTLLLGGFNAEGSTQKAQPFGDGDQTDASSVLGAQRMDRGTA